MSGVSEIPSIWARKAAGDDAYWGGTFTTTLPASTGEAMPPKAELIAAAMRSEVVKSGLRSNRLICRPAENVVWTFRSTMAPPGILPTVTMFLVTAPAAPSTANPPTINGPWATA